QARAPRPAQARRRARVAGLGRLAAFTSSAQRQHTFRGLRGMPSASNKEVTLEAYCPHCYLLIDNEVSEDWPPEPTRCPHCRLLIGEGRGKATPDANPGARGTAAGVFAHRAKRDDSDPASAEDVCEAIR